MRSNDGGGFVLYIRIMETFDHDYYNKRLKPFANKLRKDMTKAEACLWKYALKGRGIKGYQFRRQRPILKYIADFVCLELKLIIEADGLTHQLPEVYANDVIRQKALEDAGFTVLRFDDGEVLNNMFMVKQAITITIEDIERRLGIENPPPVL